MLVGIFPLAYSSPAGKIRALILDMAPSIATQDKTYKAKRRGETIPLNWTLDAEGNPTDDPAKALEGVMLPMDGLKGSALAIMTDAFSGVPSGSVFAGYIPDSYINTSKPTNVFPGRH